MNHTEFSMSRSLSLSHPELKSKINSVAPTTFSSTHFPEAPICITNNPIPYENKNVMVIKTPEKGTRDNISFEYPLLNFKRETFNASGKCNTRHFMKSLPILRTKCKKFEVFQLEKERKYSPHPYLALSVLQKEYWIWQQKLNSCPPSNWNLTRTQYLQVLSGTTVQAAPLHWFLIIGRLRKWHIAFL